MKYRYRFLFILPALFMLGCPLKSDYPLGDGRNAPMDERFVGKWVMTESGRSGKEFILILPFNENEYYIETSATAEDKASRYRAYLTVVDNVSFLNVQDLDDKLQRREYSFLKISLDAKNILTLWVVNEGQLSRKPTSRDEVLRYIRNNLGNEEIFEKLSSFKREAR